MDASREMTLSEWVNKLPKHHAAVREFDALIAHATEMQAVFKAKDRPDKPGLWAIEQDADYQMSITEIRPSDSRLHPEFAIDPGQKWFGPLPFALTETPRPATTGEGMGEG